MAWINGLKVGHYTDTAAQTGCTVVLCENGCVAGVDVRGAAPGTRETDLLTGYHLVERVQAILLTGGSAFGLDAAGGVMQYLEERGIGQDTGTARVPIVPAAVLYDLDIGSKDVRPGKTEGYAACINASASPVKTGRIGAGTGATIGKLLGPQHASPGGLGWASVEINNITVMAIVAVNALGDIYDHRSGRQIAGMQKDGLLLSCSDMLLHGGGTPPSPGSNTTIGVIATNAALTREEANRLATVAHDGLALSIRPVHTPYDGDTLFAVSTGEITIENKLPLFAAAVEATALAVEEVAICH